jgi:hypothetical protein
MKSCEQIVSAMPLAGDRVLLTVAIYSLRDESAETIVYRVESTMYWVFYSDLHAARKPAPKVAGAEVDQTSLQSSQESTCSA